MSSLTPTPQRQPPDATPGRAQVLRAAGIVSAAFVLSRLLGFGRDVVIAYYYGATSLEANAYRIAGRVPETIFFIIAGGALGSAFIPTFAAYFAREDAEGGWRLFSAVTNLVLLVLALISVGVALFARPFLLLYLPELSESPQLLTLTTAMLRVLLLSTVIFGASGVVMGALNARQHFLLPAVAPMVYNLGIILGAVLTAPPFRDAPNVMGLAWGTVFGAAGHLLIQLPALWQQRARYTPIVSIRHRGVRQVLRLMAPRVLGLSFSQINNLIIPALAQSLLIVAAIDFAWKIVLMPQSILGQALGIAAFPTFATLAASRALPEMRRILADTLRLILFIGLPAMALLMVLGEPLVTLAFERGAFDAADTSLVSWALLFFAPGLVALAMLEVISRAFYALEDTRTPVLAGAVQLLMMALLAYAFSRLLFPAFGWPTLGGLALGVSLSNLLETGFLLWLLKRKMGGIAGRHLLDGVWRVSVATLLMVSMVLLTRALLIGTRPDTGAFWQLALGGLVAAVVYLLAARGLQITELEQFVRRLPPRLRL